jgi:hypothetical protein
MSIFDSKNDSDNKNYGEGYATGRGSQDPASYVVDSLFRGFYGNEWNAGYEQGQADAEKYGTKD